MTVKSMTSMIIISVRNEELAIGINTRRMLGKHGRAGSVGLNSVDNVGTAAHDY